MIKLPNFNRAFEYENNFWLSCSPERISKILAHYKLFKLTSHLEGVIIECGVFKGASFCEFAIFRDLFCPSKKIIGFDVFGKYPSTNFKEDKAFRKKFIKEAGSQSISRRQLLKVLKNKGIIENTELIKGNVCQTVPDYVEKNPDLKVSLLNLDTDIYEPAVVILEKFWPKLVKDGILILDDYKVFPGETKAVNDFFKNKNVKIRKFRFRETPYYIIKN